MIAATYDPIAYAELPGWADDDHAAALHAFQASCARVTAPRHSPAAGGEAIAPLLMPSCKAAAALPPKVAKGEARAFFERHFQPHRVVHGGMDGLFTAYYEPVIEGSRTRQGRFQTPILRRPPDLVTVVPETRVAAAGVLTHVRQTAAGRVPFATRAEIDGGALAGQGLELLFLADPVDVYFLQVQGSGHIHLTDGSSVRVHYDGKNGHPYTSIGRYLIDKGLLAADKMSLGALGKWLKADIERARLVLNQNASYVFFKEMPGNEEGPHGALGVPLVPGRSVAIDPGYHKLGSPIYVSAPALTPLGHSRPFNRLMVAHDVGSAIRGPERADLYFGSGEEAGRIVGTIRHPGNLFVLLPNAGIAGTATPQATGSIGR